MRTHRLKLTCNTKAAAEFFEENLVHQFFVDFTHWYCGIDDAGEDTPDSCIIYRGILYPNVIYVDFDAKALSDKEAEVNAEGVRKFFNSGARSHGGIFRIERVELGHLDSYDKILELEKKVEELAEENLKLDGIHLKRGKRT